MAIHHSHSNSTASRHELKLKATMSQYGVTDLCKITNTLQGSIWKAVQEDTKQTVVIKITSRELHDQSIILLNARRHLTFENILKEKNILKHLSMDLNAPKSITKYVDFRKSNTNYYLVMEYGGHSLFHFITKAHRHIKAGQIDISEWHKMVKIVFKQMVECVEYIHSKNVIHFDISLENILINDIDVSIDGNNKIVFCTEDIQIKLCDFGLAEIFDAKSDFRCNKFCGKPNYQSIEINNRQTFNAKSNDIFCLGICLFMLLIGGSPWYKASESDECFVQFMKPNGFKYLLSKWKKSHLVNNDMIRLLKSMLQCQGKRATIADIKKSPFLQ